MREFIVICRRCLSPMAPKREAIVISRA